MTIKAPKFIFPKGIAKRMENVPMHIQMESAMISTTFLLVGLVFIAAYQMIYLDISTVLKGAIIFNILCAMVLMGGYLVTSYQQYVNYVMTCGIDLKQQKKMLRAERKARKKQKKANRLVKQLQAAGINIQSPQSSQEVSASYINSAGDNNVPEQIKPIQPIIPRPRRLRKQPVAKPMEDMDKIKKIIDDERRFIEK